MVLVDMYSSLPNLGVTAEIGTDTFGGFKYAPFTVSVRKVPDLAISST
jgi:hypothetical protein